MNGVKSSQTETDAAMSAISAFLTAESQDELWVMLIDYIEALGANVLSYHHQLGNVSNEPSNVTIRTHGYPEGWISQFIENRQHLTDPISQIFGTRIRPMRWSEISQLVPLSKAQLECFDKFRSWCQGDGFGFPVFGPGGRFGYVGVGHGDKTLDDFGVIKVNRIQWVLQNFHIRWCEQVLMNLPHDFTLNARELKILQSISNGSSDEIICGIVGAPLDSVRISIRQMMKKMGVTDRSSAIIRGIGVGLIKDNTDRQISH